jgi:hypothetical protein
LHSNAKFTTTLSSPEQKGNGRSKRGSRAAKTDWFTNDGKKRSLVVLYEDLVLVDFDDARAFVGQHLPEHLIDNAFVDKSGKIIHFFDLKGVDAVSVFIYQPDADIGRA